jgi:hypothetical protein
LTQRTPTKKKKKKKRGNKMRKKKPSHNFPFDSLDQITVPPPKRNPLQRENMKIKIHNNEINHIPLELPPLKS